MRGVCVVVALAACGPNYPREDWYGKYCTGKDVDPRGKEITLGVGDVLEIKVWDQKDLNTEATIRPDGTITMPLVGDVQATGATPSTLRDTLKVQLDKYIKLGANNEITVAVKAWKSYRFTVQGEVTRPGVYPNDEWMQVSDAIALAGGPTRFGDRDRMLLLRKPQKGRDLPNVPLNFDLLASGKRPDMNCWVLPGDVIWVP